MLLYSALVYRNKILQEKCYQNITHPLCITSTPKKCAKVYLKIAGFTFGQLLYVLFCFVWVFFSFFKIYNAGILQVPICPDFYYFFFLKIVNIMRDRDQFDNWCFLPSSRLKYKLTKYLWKNVWFNATENTHTQKQDFLSFFSLSFSGRWLII